MPNTTFPAVFDATFEPRQNWVLDGTAIPRAVAEVATPRSLALTFRVKTSDLETTLRPLKRDEGKLSVLEIDDGGHATVDRAGGSNTYTLDPPDPRQPLRRTRDYHVARYEEALVSQTVDEWDVEIEFVPTSDRTDTPSISESPAADEWGFTTPLGTIATGRVDADAQGTGRDGVKRVELRARLTHDQAHVFEAAYARIGAGRVKTIPDAPNVAQDASSDGAVTVTVDAPDSQTAISDGEYVVSEWESERITDAYQEVSVVLAKS